MYVFKSKRFTPTLECDGQCAENCEVGLARAPGLVLTPSPMRSVIQFATGSLLLLPIVNGALGRGSSHNLLSHLWYADFSSVISMFAVLALALHWTDREMVLSAQPTHMAETRNRNNEAMRRTMQHLSHRTMRQTMQHLSHRTMRQ